MDERKKKVSVTKGMANTNKGAVRKCPNCGLGIPVYPGRYPDHCPDCGSSLKKLTVDEQIEMVKAGIPAADVVKMAHPDAMETVSTCDAGIEAGQDLMQRGVDMLREQDPVSDIERAIRGVAGKVKGAGERKKKKAAEVKKHVQAGVKVGKQKKRRKVKSKLQKAKEKAAAAKKRAKQKPASKRAQRGAAKAAKKQQKAATKFRKTQFKPKKTKKESVMRTRLTPQAEGIKNSIHRRIAESGSADLSRVAQDFKANPIAVFNLVKENQEGWGLIVGGNGYIVHPRKETDRMDG